jgi:hypothetical protein
MRAVVVVGRATDPCCEAVRESLAERGRACVFVPEDDALPGLGFAWQIAGEGSEGTLTFGGRRLDFAEIDGVLARGWGLPVTPAAFRTKDGRYVSAEWNALLMAWLDRLTCPVVNRLRPELWYKTHLHVPEIVALAPGVRFEWPAVRVTTSADEAREFYRRCGGRVRYWPLTQHVPYPVESEADLDKLATLAGTLPLYLCEALAGERRDAYVVGSDVIAVDASGARADALPPSVAAQCVTIGQALGLTFCMLALVLTDAGDAYGLRLDRLPWLMGVDADVRRDIGGRLVDLLTRDGAHARGAA